MGNVDLFGNEVIEKTELKNEFLIPPFSIFDTAGGDWQNRKRKWSTLGMKSELGRENMGGSTFQHLAKDNLAESTSKIAAVGKTASIFDPVLCEVLYSWFVKKEGTILDPFAGGSVRGIVSNYLGYNYTGIELRKEQVEANREQAVDIIPDHKPNWICGDSNQIIDRFTSKTEKFDFVFSCPPYYDLEVYCDDPSDLSNMDYLDFNYTYRSIIKKACNHLKDNRYACFVVGNCRDKNGFMMDLVGETIRAFEEAGLRFYNDIVLRNCVGSASLRASTSMTYKKVVKVHQNVLVFVKGKPEEIEI